MVVYVVLSVCRGIAEPIAVYEDFSETLRHVQRINNDPVAEIYGVAAEWQELKVAQPDKLVRVPETSEGE